MSRTVRYILILAVFAGIALMFSQAANAKHPVRRIPSAPAFSVILEDEQGRTLPTFQHQGQTFVLGEPGERYNIRITNPTAQRVEAVISVDGRDAVSGRVGDFTRQRGYVLEPFGSVLVEGFRRSLDEVAAFRFTRASNSYSARRGTPQNVGIVGVAFFPERKRVAIAERSAERWHDEKRPRAPEARRRSAPSPKARTSQNNLGTEYGERQASAVREVPFVRASAHPVRVITARYDDAQGLSARGINVAWLRGLDQVRAQHEPNPFPDSSRFAPPPP